MHTTTRSWYKPIVVHASTYIGRDYLPAVGRWHIRRKWYAPLRRNSPLSTDAPAPLEAIPFGRYRGYLRPILEESKTKHK